MRILKSLPYNKDFSIPGSASPAKAGVYVSSVKAEKNKDLCIYVLNTYKDMGVGHGLFSTAVSFLRTQGLCSLYCVGFDGQQTSPGLL